MPGYSDTKYSASGVRVGTIVPHGKDTAPDGFLNCDGTAVSRTTYSALFAEIQTTYGVGDGQNTFNLPDLRDKIALGFKTNTKDIGSTGGSNTQTTVGSVSVHNHRLTIAQIPAHNHIEGGHSEFGTGSSLANQGTRNDGNAGGGKRFFTSNTGGGGVHNHGATFSGGSMSVLQPYVAVNYIIKT